MCCPSPCLSSHMQLVMYIGVFFGFDGKSVTKGIEFIIFCGSHERSNGLVFSMERVLYLFHVGS